MNYNDLTFDERVQMYMQDSRKNLINTILTRESTDKYDIYIGDIIGELIENDIIPDIIKDDCVDIESLTDEQLATVLASHDFAETESDDFEDEFDEDCPDCDCCCEDCECCDGLRGCNRPTDTDPEEHNLITDTIECLENYRDILIDCYDSGIEDGNEYNQEVSEEIEYVSEIIKSWEEING